MASYDKTFPVRRTGSLEDPDAVRLVADVMYVVVAAISDSAMRQQVAYAAFVWPVFAGMLFSLSIVFLFNAPPGEQRRQAQEIRRNTYPLALCNFGFLLGLGRNYINPAAPHYYNPIPGNSLVLLGCMGLLVLCWIKR